jgi:hypothetical protein
MFNTPILFLIFNRPDTTAIVFDKIKQQKPSRLYIAADGAREGKEGEKQKCEAARQIVLEGIDWDCQVKTLFREENLGCGSAVSQAISWFFEHVEQGIILEDDCLPDESFFKFCELLLDKYAGTKEVMSISGTNLLPNGWKAEKQSYLFAHGGIWGWATWKRAWSLYDYNMPAWGSKTNRDKIKKAIKNHNWFSYYRGLFEAGHQKTLNTWDVQWFHCILNNGGVAIIPSINLVRNIGFGPGATNTTGTDGPYSKLKINQIEFPLKHLAKIELDEKYLRASYKSIIDYKSTFSAAKRRAALYVNRLKKHLH